MKKILFTFISLLFLQSLFAQNFLSQKISTVSAGDTLMFKLSSGDSISAETDKKKFCFNKPIFVKGKKIADSSFIRSNFVDLSTNQTIAGTKTFSGDHLKAGAIFSDSYNWGNGNSFIYHNASTNTLYVNSPNTYYMFVSNPSSNVINKYNSNNTPVYVGNASGDFFFANKYYVFSGTTKGFLKADGGIDSISIYKTIHDSCIANKTTGFVDLTSNQTIAGTKNFTGTITTGGLGVKIGADAASVATGSYWTAVGQEAGYLNTIGVFWVAIGNSAGAYNATGSHWVAIGEAAGMYNATGSNWTAIGENAGAYNTTGSSATSFSNSTYFGSNTRVSDNGVENENVFGNTANGMGSNTVSLGNSSCTGLYFAGNKFLDNNKGLTVNQSASAKQALTDSTTIAWSLTSGANATLTLTNAVTARTLNASGGIAGAECRIIITQSSTATYPAVTWGTMFKFPGDTAPVLNTNANGVTMLEFFFDGTYYRLRNVLTYNS